MSLSEVPETEPAERRHGWTVLAHLLRPQGRKGEILAELLTDFPARFDDRDQLYLAPTGFSGLPSAARPIRVSSHWLPVGRNQGRIVLGLDGIDSIEKAETLAHLEVIVPDSARVELDEDESYIDDLIDCEVFDGDFSVGRVTGVDFPTTPDGARRLEDAAPLLTVQTPEGDEVLIPYVQSFLVSLSVEQKQIRMKLPAGLLDLNRRAESAGQEQPTS
jgi:16S rRNA processing protein RimM